MKRMLFNATQAEETRVAIVDGQKLVDIDIETAGHEQHKSNIYKGIITRIEPSLEACFVDYGEERHGFLPFKEVSRSYFSKDVDVHTCTIKEALREGQEILVQVEKEERGNKGAALTTFISLAGRYVVLMPNNPRGGGVSRRIEGEERQELRHLLEELKLPQGMSVIARTAGIGRTIEELQWDLDYLLKLWAAICDAATPMYELAREENGRRQVTYVKDAVVNGQKLRRMNPAPFLIVEESALVIRAIRDYFQPDIGELLVDTDNLYDQARQFMLNVMPDMVDRVKRYREDIPLFSRFQIENQIETAYSRTVTLPSGGSIVIDHTEALVAVDVNSARSTRGADIEETAFRTNCEAADEIARQMRLRDLGGLIVIDFIDMEDPRNQRSIEQRMKDALKYDRARVQMAKISRFGLMELSRQRLRPALAEGHHITCPRCNGLGVIRNTESSALQVLRILQEEAAKDGTGAIHAQVPVDVATYLLNEKRQDIEKIEQRNRIPVVLIPNPVLETPHYHIERIRQNDERLDDQLASYERAEDLQPVTTDPYALKSDEDKPAAPRQVPVIKNIARDTPAPVHVDRRKEEEAKKPAAKPAEPAAKAEPKPEAAPAAAPSPKKGFFGRLIDMFLGGSSAEPAPQEARKAQTAAPAAPAAEEQPKREGQDSRRRSRGGRRRQGQRPEGAEQGEPQQLADRREKREAAEQTENRRRRSRRSRRPTDAEALNAAAPAGENSLPAQEQAPAQAPEAKPETKPEAPAEEVRAEQPSETAPDAQQPQDQAQQPSEGRRRRRHHSRKPREENQQSQEQSTPEDVKAKELKEIEAKAARLADAPASSAEAAAEVTPVAAAVAEAVEGDAAQKPEGRQSRRRPRRRGGKNQAAADSRKPVEAAPEAVAPEAAAPAEAPVPEGLKEEAKAEATEAASPAPEAAEPAPEAQVEEAPAEEAPAAAAEPAAPEAPAAAASIAEGTAAIEAELEKAGLFVVHTNPELVGEVCYTQPKAPGRPREVLPPAESGEMIQVESNPELIGEVSYAQPKAPGRPREVLPPEEKVEMIQVETLKK
ncbi:MAG: ribonuclease E/G [Mesosutterella sp.]|nr:ribonuclease E/G [Mesosutterella sp.]